jgi:ribokinase
MTQDAGGPPRPARVAVVGSLNVDLVFTASRRPGAGETLRGTAFDVYTGGKGANQALAAARAGGLVSLVGRTGDDPFGAQLRAALEADGVDLRHTAVDAAAGTGVAGIVVEPDGSNSIVVVSRANGRLGPPDVARAAGAIEEAAVLLLQLETPLAAAVSAARLARGAGRMVVLNPAPAPHPDQGQAQEGLSELLRLTDIVVPNETEAGQLTGMAADTAAGALRAGRALLAAGPRAVLITLGDRGALLVEAHQDVPVPPFDVHAVDTTAAGDAFCGALAVALAEGQSLPLAARFAAAAGALAVTVAGAGPSLPRRQEIERLCVGHA